MRISLTFTRQISSLSQSLASPLQVYDTVWADLGIIISLTRALEYNAFSSISEVCQADGMSTRDSLQKRGHMAQLNS